MRAVRTSPAVPASRGKNQEKVSIAHRLRRSDVLLFLIAVALGGIGVLAIYAAEADYRQLYAVNQALGLVAGLVGAIVLALVDYRWLGRRLRFVYGATIVMLVAVLAAGFSVNGAQSWIGVGPIEVQPSEFAKPLSIVVLAGYVAESSFAHNMTFLKALGIMSVPVLLVLAQPDLGTAMVFGAIFVAVVFVGGARWYQLGGLFAAGCVAVYLAIKLRILEDYQIARLTSFLDPQSVPAGVSYQVENSKMAIGSGGLTGKGLRSSGTLGDLGYLPEDRTDFIFSNLAEKVGFVGSLVVLILFFLLVWRVLHAATVSRDRFGVLIAVGVATMLTFHALINVGMAMGMMPVTGLPLPFVSYGRSNLLVSMMSVGLVQSIVIQARLKSEGNPRA
ncbi:MAG TPA: rod shape-determining protein RodA [Rubrobacter sp.]|jgi:rod shape determining protein RodA|nr:rod shape-determining protein RodA [Rubrobacter sp.]